MCNHNDLLRKIEALQTELDKTLAEYREAEQQERERRENFAKSLLQVKGMTAKMRERVYKAIDKGLKGEEVAKFALGASSGWRFNNLVECLKLAGL